MTEIILGNLKKNERDRDFRPFQFYISLRCNCYIHEALAAYWEPLMDMIQIHLALQVVESYDAQGLEL